MRKPEHSLTMEWMQAHSRNGPCYNWPMFDYLSSPSSNIATCNCSDIVGTDGSRSSHVADGDRRTDSLAVYLEVMVLTLP